MTRSIACDPERFDATHRHVQTPNAPYLAERKTFCVFRRPSARPSRMGKKRPKKACMAPSSGIGNKPQATDSKELIKSTGSRRKNSRNPARASGTHPAISSLPTGFSGPDRVPVTGFD
ncbi:hypothetical protein [Azotobacter beijerinckii]|uniref:hypothetical protein n=1 Tax=Azotobacter beijerinckii TaxID=170623 RepID=UPI001113B696|nr:hypothetical protein [Azotobacter beijerinckii]